MTKTYTARAKGQPYTMTVEDAVLPNGERGLRLTCSCATHAGTSGAAYVDMPMSAEDFLKSRIHGYVTMAHSPIGSRHRKVWKA
jgi:hypothetical protein